MPKKLKFDLSSGELVAFEEWYGDPKKLFSNLQTNNRSLASRFRFMLYIEENGSKTIENMGFYEIGLILAQKWKRMTQMSIQTFWGVFREVFGPLF